jgi:hypothetical protein
MLIATSASSGCGVLVVLVDVDSVVILGLICGYMPSVV